MSTTIKKFAFLAANNAILRWFLGITYWILFWIVVSLFLNDRFVVSLLTLVYISVAAVLMNVAVMLFILYYPTKNAPALSKADQAFALNVLRIPIALGEFGILALVLHILVNRWTGLIRWLSL
ncbi:MAG: hypothetical protein A2X94_03180 [Bdellovibrionales bacterium GWB1_55_8]|nr:MAG: hypothetical protein A2X94_03180 [Bdellovibrionales bacterium GWB1_55_8]